MYDVETFCTEVKNIMTSYLNTKIAAINSEKNDSTVLANVSSSAYNFQELDSQVVNYDPFILYAVENINAISSGPKAAQDVTMHVILVLNDPGQDLNMSNRMFRYQRALREIFEEHWTENRNQIKIEISSLVPVKFPLMNSGNLARAIGIAIRAVLP